MTPSDGRSHATMSVPVLQRPSVPRTPVPAVGTELTLPPIVGRVLLTITVIGSCLGAIWSIADVQGQFLLFGMLACLVVTIPITRPGYAVLGPWSLIALLIYVSCGIRGVFIALDLDGRQSIDALFLLGHSPAYFTRASVLYVIALALIAAGYLWRPRHEAGGLVRKLRSLQLPPLTGAVAVVLAAVGLVAFVLYANRTGGLASGLSMKRTTITGLTLDDTYRSYGELRFFNTFSSIAFWLHVARHAAAAGRPSVGTRLASAAYFINAILLPVFASARSDVAYIALVAFAIHYGVSHRLPRGRTVVRWAVVCVLGLAAMTGARLASHANDGAAFGSRQALTDSVGEVMVYNRNFGDMQTTAHIIHAIPQSLPYAHGTTITTWLVAPVPRALWPDKPVLQSGPVIGKVVYGNERSGVPPAFVAEMYWNFATAGVLLGSLLLGLALAYVRESFTAHLRNSPGVALMYAVGMMRIGAYVFANGVGSGIFALVSDLSCLLAALVLVRLMGSTAKARPVVVQTTSLGRWR